MASKLTTTLTSAILALLFLGFGGAEAASAPDRAIGVPTVACLAQNAPASLEAGLPALAESTTETACNPQRCYLSCVRKGYFSGHCVGETCVCRSTPGT